MMAAQIPVGLTLAAVSVSDLREHCADRLAEARGGAVVVIYETRGEVRPLGVLVAVPPELTPVVEALTTEIAQRRHVRFAARQRRNAAAGAITRRLRMEAAAS